MIEHIGEQQIIHVAAMARHIDNLVAILRQLAHFFAAINVDALIETTPEPAHHAVGNANRFIREVGGNFFHHLDSILLRFLMGDFFAACFIFDSFFNRFGLQQTVKEILTRR